MKNDYDDRCKFWITKMKLGFKVQLIIFYEYFYKWNDSIITEHLEGAIRCACYGLLFVYVLLAVHSSF